MNISKKKIKEFKLKIQNNNSKKNLMSNKNILENLSTNRQSNISPLSSERIKNEIEKKTLTPLNEKSDFFSKNKKSNFQIKKINNSLIYINISKLFIYIFFFFFKFI